MSFMTLNILTETTSRQTTFSSTELCKSNVRQAQGYHKFIKGYMLLVLVCLFLHIEIKGLFFCIYLRFLIS